MNYLIFFPPKCGKPSFVRYGLQRKIEIMVLNEKPGIAKGKIYYSLKDLFYLSKVSMMFFQPSVKIYNFINEL